MMVFSGSTPPPALDSLVPDITAPLMIIYTDSNPAENSSPKYAGLAHDDTELWNIPESDHIGGLEARPEEYEERVVGFFDRALPPRQ
jgi:hypothetical protein